MTVRPLTRESADRLTTVLTDAAVAVEAGETPDRAIAKAASEHGMPLTHVPLAVRGYNTGRAARQQAESTDPWVRAAPYPTASVDGVYAALNGHTPGAEKVAADYLRVPVRDVPPAPDLNKLASLLGIEGVKSAAYTLPADTRVIRRTVKPAVPEGAIKFSEAVALAAENEAKLAAALKNASPAEYAAAKFVCSRKYPEAAAFAFRRLDARFPKKAAAPDPSFPADHPVVGLVAALDYARKVAKTHAPHKWIPAPLICRQGKVVAIEEEAADKAAGFRDSILPRALPTLVPGSSDPGPVGGAANSLYGLVGRVNDTRGELKEQNRMQALQMRYGGLGGGLPPEFKHLATQETINALLQDPRLRAADPAHVVQSYQSLAGLAPNIMRNPAVAGEFVHRTIQTGPLSYHDLGQLTKMERDYTASRRGSGDDED